MNLSFKIKRSCLAATAGVAILGAPLSGALVSYDPGDLVVGFQATAGQGSDSTFAFNLGPATALRDNPQGATFNIGGVLTDVFGADWFSRGDLRWGAVANRTNNPFAAPVDGDPRQTVYVSAAATGIGQSLAWTGYGPALGTASTYMQGFFTGPSGGFENLDAAPDTDGRGAIGLTSHGNSWAAYHTLFNSFEVFTGGIQGSLAGQTAYLDVYRILGTTTGADPIGPVGDGVWVTTLALDSGGNLAAIPEPGTVAALLGLFAMGVVLIVRRRSVSKRNA